ncbi:HK97 family phage prohead protease [Cytobacillus sp. FSL M8-0252]|uniref:HK97 family phage prohead protease n=1 Tax=Cytobacillus sp. FSL M8-0252 TaxID=2921621 RepID=UPI0030F69E49
MNSLVISGYALCWNEKSFIEKQWNRQFYEQFQRGAFSDSIKTRKQRLLLFHNDIYEIVNDKEGQLTFLEDEKGLAFRINLPNNSNGRLVYNLVQSGTINHVSIGFTNGIYKPNQRYRHFPFHYVNRADLHEISLVSNPAYKTSIVHTGCNNVRLNLMSNIDQSLKI